MTIVLASSSSSSSSSSPLSLSLSSSLSLSLSSSSSSSSSSSLSSPPLPLPLPPPPSPSSVCPLPEKDKDGAGTGVGVGGGTVTRTRVSRAIAAYTSRDLILYALGVGCCGHDRDRDDEGSSSSASCLSSSSSPIFDESRYAHEGNARFRPFPTFPLALAFVAAPVPTCVPTRDDDDDDDDGGGGYDEDAIRREALKSASESHLVAGLFGIRPFPSAHMGGGGDDQDDHHGERGGKERGGGGRSILPRRFLRPGQATEGTLGEEKGRYGENSSDLPNLLPVVHVSQSMRLHRPFPTHWDIGERARGRGEGSGRDIGGVGVGVDVDVSNRGRQGSATKTRLANRVENRTTAASAAEPLHDPPVTILLETKFVSVVPKAIGTFVTTETEYYYLPPRTYDKTRNKDDTSCCLLCTAQSTALLVGMPPDRVVRYRREDEVRLDLKTDEGMSATTTARTTTTTARTTTERKKGGDMESNLCPPMVGASDDGRHRSRRRRRNAPFALPGAVPTVDKDDEQDDAFAVEYRTRPDQALLYRLSGDYNPLHVDASLSDSAFSRGINGGGDDRTSESNSQRPPPSPPSLAPVAPSSNSTRPILHGLCTLGFAVRAALDWCRFRQSNIGGNGGSGGSRPRRTLRDVHVTYVGCRFVEPVRVGDVLRVHVWNKEKEKKEGGKDDHKGDEVGGRDNDKYEDDAGTVAATATATAILCGFRVFVVVGTGSGGGGADAGADADSDDAAASANVVVEDGLVEMTLDFEAASDGLCNPTTTTTMFASTKVLQSKL